VTEAATDTRSWRALVASQTPKRIAAISAASILAKRARDAMLV